MPFSFHLQPIFDMQTITKLDLLTLAVSYKRSIFFLNSTVQRICLFIQVSLFYDTINLSNSVSKEWGEVREKIAVLYHYRNTSV